LLLQAPAQFSRVFWFLSHTCPLVQTKVLIRKAPQPVSSVSLTSLLPVVTIQTTDMIKLQDLQTRLQKLSDDRTKTTQNPIKLIEIENITIKSEQLIF
jgi:hypothetical protein